jgi:hypothetical protein
VDVEVVRSARRRKTVSARRVDGVLRVSIPAAMTTGEERRWVAEMVRRFERRERSATVDLPARAAVLARRFDLPQPASIRWVENQRGWVLDHVIVHELVHLVEPGHGPAFQALLARDPLAERATGFLIAKGMDPADAEEPDEPG